MNLPRILMEFLSTPWAILPDRLAIMGQVLNRWASGVKLSAEEIRAAVGDAPEIAAARRDAATRSGGGLVAVIPVYGIVTQRGNMMDALSGPGSTSTQQLTGSVRDALNDDDVSAIVLDVDSPGGSVYGVPEVADVIYDGRDLKPIYAVANSLAASAAYWIGSAASEFYVTPSGEVGSIGVWIAHSDISGLLEKVGEKVSLISAGKYKTEGNPYEPLSEEARAAFQARVDDYYGMFVRAVARHRGASVDDVRAGYGEGRTLGAADSLAAHLVDGVKTFDEVLALAMKASPQKRKSASRVEHTRRALSILDA